MAKIALVYYSTYGHVKAVAEAIAGGIRSVGGTATLLQVPETLSSEVLAKMGAPPKDTSIPIAEASMLPEYDGILFGTPTRFGMAAAQMKAFMDSTGGLWMQKALTKKTGGVFFSTATQAGGQETTALTFLTQLSHHGMIYVPMGYTNDALGQNKEIAGGSPYGPGTIAESDGSRQLSELEKKGAFAYGERFAKVTQAISNSL